MDGRSLADHIRRSLRVLIEGRFAWRISGQVDDRTTPEQTEDEGRAELVFAIRGMPTAGTPSAYLVLREARRAANPERVTGYWYGLVHRRATGDLVYEAWHRHDHGTGTPSQAHYHLKVNDVTRQRAVVPEIHVQDAIERLLDALDARVADDQGE